MSKYEVVHEGSIGDNSPILGSYGTWDTLEHAKSAFRMAWDELLSEGSGYFVERHVTKATASRRGCAILYTRDQSENIEIHWLQIIARL